MSYVFNYPADSEKSRKMEYKFPLKKNHSMTCLYTNYVNSEEPIEDTNEEPIKDPVLQTEEDKLFEKYNHESCLVFPSFTHAGKSGVRT